MELKQARGNTWYLADMQLIPLYRLDEHRCILLDSGMYAQRALLDRALGREGLIPVGILGSHSHFDHSSNHRYLQQRYQIPVAMSLAEAALASTPETLKTMFFAHSPAEFLADAQGVRHMEVRCDRVILPEEREVTLGGVRFEIVPTPGHSAGHISVRTPDDVLYLADAMMAGRELEQAKLPYHFNHMRALETLEHLKSVPAACYLAAHRGVLPELGDLPDQNIAKIRDRAEQILALLSQPVHICELTRLVCQHFGLHSSRPELAAKYERNVRTYLDYLRDTGRVDTILRDGVFYYQRKD
ncbi:MAG: MBL fold metallo-hydrolase [Oscillospiraceae bacterium]|nr:MBL fold metallo-hydrolase [Oscillospiraceae bacterium]